MKRSLNEWGDTPRSIRGLVTKAHQQKIDKEKMANEQTSSELAGTPVRILTCRFRIFRL